MDSMDLLLAALTAPMTEEYILYPSDSEPLPLPTPKPVGERTSGKVSLAEWQKAITSGENMSDRDKADYGPRSEAGRRPTMARQIKYNPRSSGRAKQTRCHFSHG